MNLTPQESSVESTAAGDGCLFTCSWGGRPACLSTNNKHPAMTSHLTLTSCEHYFGEGRKTRCCKRLCMFKKKKVCFNIAFLHAQTNNALCTQYIVLACIVIQTLVGLMDPSSWSVVRLRLRTQTNKVFRLNVMVIIYSHRWRYAVGAVASRKFLVNTWRGMGRETWKETNWHGKEKNAR